MEEEKNHNKIWMTISLVVVMVIVFAGIVGAAVWYFGENNREEEAVEQNQCQDISTDDWLAYENEYSIDYPKDWVYKELNGGEGATQWSVGFGPTEDNILVYLGVTAKEVDGYIEDLANGEMVNNQGKYQLLDQTEVSALTSNDVRLTLQGPESYKSYSFYLKPTANLLPILLGPSDASSDQFENCEPEIFIKMVESYQAASLVGDGMEYYEYYTYTDDDSLFSIELPVDWILKDRYYYQTAAGEKSKVPTLRYEPTPPTIDASKNYLVINQRQAFCPDLPSHNTEPVALGSDRVISFSYDTTTDRACAEITLDGVDIDGNTADYHFMMLYDSSIEGKEIIKNIVASYLDKNDMVIE